MAWNNVTEPKWRPHDYQAQVSTDHMYFCGLDYPPAWIGLLLDRTGGGHWIHDKTGHSECRRKWINGTDVGFWCWIDDQKHKADYCDCQQG